jgi:hypothetical protein
LDFTLDPSPTAGFHLLRNVANDTFRHRHTGRRKAKKLAFDQGSGQFNAIQLSLGDQPAACSSASATASS